MSEENPPVKPQGEPPKPEEPQPSELPTRLIRHDSLPPAAAANSEPTAQEEPIPPESPAKARRTLRPRASTAETIRSSAIPISDSPQEEKPMVENVPPEPAAPVEAPKKDNKKTIIIIVVVVLVLLCCCCVVIPAILLLTGTINLEDLGNFTQWVPLLTSFI